MTTRLSSVSTGYKTVCRPNIGLLAFLQGKNFRVVDTSIWSSNIFGIFDASSYNSTYQNVQIVPDPTPRNRPPPLFSSNADGIHCVFVSFLIS